MRVFHLALALIFLGMVAIAAIFTNPDASPCEMPCMFGIRPFSTRAVDLPHVFATHPFLRHLQRREIGDSEHAIYVLSDNSQTITVIADIDGIVREIDWVMNACKSTQIPVIGDFIAVLGNPSIVSIKPFTRAATVYMYSAWQIEIVSNRRSIRDDCKNTVNQEWLNPQNIVTEIFMANPSDSENFKQGINWQGFRQAQFYFPR